MTPFFSPNNPHL